MTYQVLVSCTQIPCLKCRAGGEPGYFCKPVANGRFESRSLAELDAQKCRDTTGRDGKHRYDVTDLRPDGWPLCPWCGNDELYSLSATPTPATICGCYVCGVVAPSLAVVPDTGPKVAS